VETFCWSASQAERFAGVVAEVDAVADAMSGVCVGGAALPAEEEEDAVTGSAAIDASIDARVSLGLVQYTNAAGATATPARTASFFFNRAP
jgi:hypothetical protein